MRQHDDYSFSDIIKLVSYPQITNLDNGLNEHLRIQDAIEEFELI